MWLCLVVLVDSELASELVAPDEDDDDVTIADDNMDSCYALSLCVQVEETTHSVRLGRQRGR